MTVVRNDGAHVVFGTLLPLADTCRSAAQAALDMMEVMDLFNVERTAVGQAAVSVS